MIPASLLQRGSCSPPSSEARSRTPAANSSIRRRRSASIQYHPSECASKLVATEDNTVNRILGTGSQMESSLKGLSAPQCLFILCGKEGESASKSERFITSWRRRRSMRPSLEWQTGLDAFEITCCSLPMFPSRIEL